MTPLKKLFGKSVELEKLPADLKALLEEMRKERNAFEAMVMRSQGILKRAEDLGPTVAKAEPQLAALKERLAALEAALPQTAEFQSRLAEMVQSQGDLETGLGETAGAAQRAGSELAELRPMLEEAMSLKQHLAGFRELDAQVRDMTARFEQVRAGQDAVQRQTAEASSRLAGFDKEWRNVTAAVEALGARFEKFEQTAQQLQELTTEMPNTKHELGTLRALADYVSQKLSELEGQRDAVDRATRGAERLAELVAKVDRQLQEQQTNTKFLSKLDESVDQLKKMHEPLLEQSEQIREGHRAIEAESQARREEFADLLKEVQAAVAKFTFDRDGLEATSQRVAELREQLGSVEQRLPALGEMRNALEGAESAAERVAARVDALGPQLAQLETDAARLRAAAKEGDRAAQLLQAFEEQAARLARFETQVAELVGAEERVQRSLANLTERQGAIDAVRSDLQRLFEVASGTVEQVRTVAAVQQDIEERRASLDNVIAELRELENQGKTLEERKKQFQEAEERMSRLDALVTELKGTLQTVTDQKEFLEKVVETAGTLAFQTMQAEAVINTLRQEREAGLKKTKS